MTTIDSAERCGKFFIGAHMIRKYPDLVKKIMGECIIVKAEMSYIRHGIEYEAISDWFDFVPQGEYAPEYTITIHKQGNNLKWMFEKG